MQNFTIHSSFVRKPEFCRTMSRLRRHFIELGSCLRRNDGELQEWRRLAGMAGN